MLVIDHRYEVPLEKIRIGRNSIFDKYLEKSYFSLADHFGIPTILGDYNYAEDSGPTLVKSC